MNSNNKDVFVINQNSILYKTENKDEISSAVNDFNGNATNGIVYFDTFSECNNFINKNTVLYGVPFRLPFSMLPVELPIFDLELKIPFTHNEEYVNDDCWPYEYENQGAWKDLTQLMKIVAQHHGFNVFDQMSDGTVKTMSLASHYSIINIELPTAYTGNEYINHFGISVKKREFISKKENGENTLSAKEKTLFRGRLFFETAHKDLNTILGFLNL